MPSLLPSFFCLFLNTDRVSEFVNSILSLEMRGVRFESVLPPFLLALNFDFEFLWIAASLRGSMLKVRMI